MKIACTFEDGTGEDGRDGTGADNFYEALVKASERMVHRGFGEDEREGLVLLILVQIFSRHIPFVEYTLGMLKHERITGGAVIEILLSAVPSNKSLVTSPETTNNTPKERSLTYDLTTVTFGGEGLYSLRFS